MEETGNAGATHESTGNVTDNNELVTISRNARGRNLQMKSYKKRKKERLKGMQTLVRKRVTFPGLPSSPNDHSQCTQVGQLTKANKVD